VRGAETFRALPPRELRLELEALYADYTGCLDEERFEDWPAFFTEPCLYKIVPRDNFERGLPLATWLCESQGYLLDRVTGIRKTSVYAPRRIRRIVSGIRIIGWNGDALETRASFAAFETLIDELTRVFIVGEHRDRIVAADGVLKFREKVIVFDSLLVPNSLIYPL